MSLHIAVTQLNRTIWEAHQVHDLIRTMHRYAHGKIAMAYGLGLITALRNCQMRQKYDPE